MPSFVNVGAGVEGVLFRLTLPPTDLDADGELLAVHAASPEVVNVNLSPHG